MSIFSKITWIDQIKDALGNIIQQGTPVSANNMNRIEQGVEDAADELEEIKTGSKKVGDAEKLDGVDSLDYARTDTAETFENNVFINGDLQLGYDGLIGDREIKLWAENGYNVKMLTFETPTHGMGIRYNANDNILYVDRYPNQTTPISLAKFYRDVSKIDFSVTDLQQNGNKIWQAGNDGAGSGLDADKLDGQEGSYYNVYGNLTNKPTTLASFKKGTGTLSAGTNSKTVTDSFITADTQVIVNPTAVKENYWEVVSYAGYFIITSREEPEGSAINETNAVTFDWSANKGGA